MAAGTPVRCGWGMAGKIFINYRRGDDPGHTGRLFDRLQQEFAADQLFMDVDSIAPGLDFARVLEDQVGKCDVLLAVIGKGWIDARDGAGARRLENPEDFVAIEIGAGLRLGKRVIPVLVNDADMPRAEDLPDALKPLARRNAVRLTHDRFRADTQGLMKALTVALEEADAARRASEDADAVAAQQRRLDEAKRAEDVVAAQREQARLAAIAGLSPSEITKAEELANWEFIKGRDGAQEFRDHLARFPSGVTARYARERLEAVTWMRLAASSSLDDLKAFVAEFPEGVHGEEARARIVRLSAEAEAARILSAREAEETAAWAAASDTDRVKDYEAFLKAWPKGIHVSAAKARIRELNRGTRSPWRWALLGAAAMAVVASAGWYTFDYVREQQRLLAIEKARLEAEAKKQAEAKLIEDIKGSADREWLLARAKERPDLGSLVSSRLEGLGYLRLSTGTGDVWRKPGAGESFSECPHCPEMVVVPAGDFLMGSPDGKGSDNEHPQHKVTVAKPFAVGKLEVTFDQWDACVVQRGCSAVTDDRDWGRGSRPVINVSWDDAKTYVAWLAKLTGKSYRLLTEAEWEYSARAGAATDYSWGGAIGGGNANCDGCGSQWDNTQTAPAGSFKPNAFGFYDMHGNVWEWVEDCYESGYWGAPDDGSARTNGECSSRVLRGGSWYNFPRILRSAFRLGIVPSSRNVGIGFRLARTL